MIIDAARVKIIEGNLAVAGHRAALVRLINAYMNDPMGQKRELDSNIAKRLILELSRFPTARLFFAEYDGELIGLAVSFIGFSTFYAKNLLNIHDLIVLPEYRNNGIAPKILLAVEQKAKAMDCCKLTLEVRTDNTEALKIYKRFGFGCENHAMYFWTKML